MPYQIIISEKEKCLIVTYKRDLAIIDYLQIATEIGELLYEKYWDRIVVDARNQCSSFSIVDKCGLATKAATLFPVGTRLALLTLYPEKEDINFVRSLFLKRGIFFEIFHEFEKAVGWLLQEKK